MTTLTASSPSTSNSVDEARWNAVVARDLAADGAFVYSVKTTGVYCRPTCAARLPRRENLRFFDTPRDAERAGFRPCKRCRPQDAPLVEQQRVAITAACRRIDESRGRLNINDLAESVGMSPSHFRRVFKSIVGMTPKAYTLARRAERLRGELAEDQTVASAAYGAGFESSARLYADADRALGMSPREFQGGAPGCTIRFAVGECSLGAILVAATDRGVCAISLGDEAESLVHALENRFPAAELVAGDAEFDRLVAQAVGLVERPHAGHDLPLDIRGTVFQQRVWKLLAEIPAGQTATYSEIARRLGSPNSTRAVANAVAVNPLAVAIPCHRVVRTDGLLTGYRWGIERKEKLLERERAGD